MLAIIKNTRLNAIILTIVGFLWLLLATAFVYLVYPYRGLTDISSPFPVLNENKTVKQGDNVIYQVSFCKNGDRMLRVTRKLVDGVVLDLSPYNGEYMYLLPGCQTFKRSALLPAMDLSSAPKKIIIIVEDKVNILRTNTYTFETEPFIITK